MVPHLVSSVFEVSSWHRLCLKMPRMAFFISRAPKASYPIFITALLTAFSIPMALMLASARVSVSLPTQQTYLHACLRLMIEMSWQLGPHWLYANSSRAHENRARVSRPSFPRAGDAIHPVLRKWEDLDLRLHKRMASNPPQHFA